MADVFEKRLRRAEHLAQEWPFAAELLRFYSGIFRIQQAVYLDRGPSGPLLFMDQLIVWIEQHGFPHLVEAAETLKPLSFPERVKAFGEFLELDPAIPVAEPDNFLWMVLAQSSEMRSSLDPRKPPEPPPPEPARACPRCRRCPVVSLLREDKAAETVRRSLVCSRCCLEWDFPRVLCPNCDEEHPEKLPRYTAQEIPWMRVEACDTCRKYLKSVDLTLNWDADPVVDELASTPLDVIAREHGYTKIAPNLAGI